MAGLMAGQMAGLMSGLMIGLMAGQMAGLMAGQMADLMIGLIAGQMARGWPWPRAAQPTLVNTGENWPIMAHYFFNASVLCSHNASSDAK